MKLLIAFALVGAVLLLLSLGNRAVPDSPDQDPVTSPVDVSIPKLQAPTSTSTSTTTAPPQARARTAPIVTASASRPTSEVADIIRSAFARFGPEVAEEAVRVAGCESTGDASGQRLNPAAMNGAHYGLFQVSRTYHDARVRRLGFTWEQMTEAGPNAVVAADLYGEQRWGPWECRWAA